VKLTTHLHLVPRSRMRGATPPLSQYVLKAWCLAKNRDNFTFTFILQSPKFILEEVSICVSYPFSIVRYT
jgi:hypothetical protein